jgi:hypothetical protein
MIFNTNLISDPYSVALRSYEIGWWDGGYKPGLVAVLRKKISASPVVQYLAAHYILSHSRHLKGSC